MGGYSATRSIADGFDGARSAIATDFDGDGDLDVVAAGSNDDEVTLYEGDGGQYIVWTFDLAPETLNNSSTVPIFKIIPLHAGISGDIDMELRNISIGIDDGAGTPLTSSEANALIEGLHVWFDADSNGTFDTSSDDLLANVDDITLSPSGFTTIAVPHGTPNPSISLSSIHSFFLVVTTTNDASSQTPNRFRILHRNSAALTRYYDFPEMELRPVEWSSVYATTVTCGHEVFADGFESGGTGAWDSTTN